MPEHIINFENDLERNKFLRDHLKTEIICEVCNRNNFMVEQKSPKQIVLTCINCGWIKTISPKTFGKKNFDIKFQVSKKKTS